MLTFQENILARPGSVPSSGLFTLTHGLVMSREAIPERYKEYTQSPSDASDQERPMKVTDPLVRLSAVRESESKVTVLQKWVGRVERFVNGKLTAVVIDITNQKNPPEEVEMSADEISSSDLPLAVVGATFYWSVGYRDSRGGQRERVSTLRFARQPQMSSRILNRVYEEADQIASLLLSE